MTEVEYKQLNKKWNEGYVYVLDYGEHTTFKIGSTIGDPSGRLLQINQGLPVVMPKVELVMSCWTNTNCRLLEELLHMRFDSQHVKGEWFKLGFTDLLEIYQIFYSFGAPNIYKRWYELVPEDAVLARERGQFDWISAQPFLSKAEELEDGKIFTDYLSQKSAESSNEQN